jgi:uncharacterized membrane protein YgdD (TMEM256/DUF423 family)
MKILDNFSFSLAAEDVLSAQYLGRRDSFPAPILDSARGAIEEGMTLFSPAAVYDEFPVCGFDGETMILSAGSGEARLRIGPKVDLLHAAERVLVGVNTIGPALERRVGELQANREPLEAYMLDAVGVVALGAVGEALRRIAEQRAAELKWGVGAALAPGSLLGWAMNGQRELCSLLPLDAIGVQLNPSCVLEPHKSASFLVGIGPTYRSSRVGSVCRFCALAGSCWRRRKDEHTE